MFTGIITDLGEVTAIDRLASGLRLTVATGYDVAAIPPGASIAHDGVCLTVVEKESSGEASRPSEPSASPHASDSMSRSGGNYKVEVSPETLDKTTLGSWQAGRRVNLERPLKAGEEFGGHFVSGHVDAVGEVRRCLPQDAFLRMEIAFPAALRGHIAAKGSVAVNGVSLTVNAVKENRMELMVIPHTAQVTNLGALQPGDPVNLEVDLIARYVASLLKAGTVDFPLKGGRSKKAAAAEKQND